MIDTNISQGFHVTIQEALSHVAETSGGSSQTPHTTHTANLDPNRLIPLAPSDQAPEAADYDPPTAPDYE